MNDQMESERKLLTKWFPILFYIHAVSIVLSFISLLPIVDTWTTWISWAVMAGVVVCMFQLGGVSPRYRKAAIFRTVMLCCTWINGYLFSSTVLLLAASVLSILAVYQEYSAHSELVAQKDPKLSRNWHRLFNWGILSAILLSFGSMVAALLAAMLEMDTARTATIIVGVLSVPQFVIDILYLLYLKKMIRIFEQEDSAAQSE